MTEAVLDSSALLAALLREPGGDLVESLAGEAAICAVNFAEVVGYYARNGSDAAAVGALRDRLASAIVPFDEGLAFQTGLLEPRTRPAGLSLADRACLALARRLGVRALTADRQWADVAEAVGVEVQLIR